MEFSPFESDDLLFEFLSSDRAAEHLPHTESGMRIVVKSSISIGLETATFKRPPLGMELTHPKPQLVAFPSTLQLYWRTRSAVKVNDEIERLPHLDYV